MPKPPRHIRAVLSALQFRRASPEELRSLDDATWRDLLAYTDSTHLTLHLAASCHDFLPDWVQERTGRNFSDNCQRFDQTKAAYREIALAFVQAGVDFIVLKGFCQWPDYSGDLRFRLQSDIDFYCPGESLLRARDLLVSLGYVAVPTSSYADHLPIMVRQGGWQWKGNYYDPDIPAMVELHYRLWNRQRLRFGPSSLEQFWARRELRCVDGIDFPALHWVDNLGFSALQVVRDLVTHGLLLHKVYELARFLHHNAENDAFWQEWTALEDSPLRLLQATAFRLAVQCFDCDVSPVVADHMERLSKLAKKWILHYPGSCLNPIEDLTKDALWLHLALIDSMRDKLAIGFRGLVPVKLQTDPEMIAISDGGVTPQSTLLRRRIRRASYAMSRVSVHAQLIPATLWHGLRLWWATREFKVQA